MPRILGRGAGVGWQGQRAAPAVRHAVHDLVDQQHGKAILVRIAPGWHGKQVQGEESGGQSLAQAYLCNRRSPPSGLLVRSALHWQQLDINDSRSELQ